MAQRVVLVEYSPKGEAGRGPLTVRLSDGESVPMDEFLKTHKAVQVSALTHAGTSTGDLYLALMIADRTKGQSSW